MSNIESGSLNLSWDEGYTPRENKRQRREREQRERDQRTAERVDAYHRGESPVFSSDVDEHAGQDPSSPSRQIPAESPPIVFRGQWEDGAMFPDKDDGQDWSSPAHSDHDSAVDNDVEAPRDYDEDFGTHARPELVDPQYIPTLEELEASIDEETRAEITVFLTRRRQRQGLDEDDLKAIKSVIFMDNVRLSEEQWELLGGLFGSLQLPTMYKARKVLQDLADIRTVTYDACPVGHMCYAGKWSSEQACLECGIDRYNAVTGAPNGSFTVIDPACRIRAQLENTERASVLYDQFHSAQRDGVIRDFTDSEHYTSLRRTRLPGPGQVKNYFETYDHVPMMLATDGVVLFKKKSVWPVVLVNLALPPTMRYKSNELIVVGVIYGHPKYADSFLAPLVELATEATTAGFEYVSTKTRKLETARYSIILGAADSRAMEMLTHSKGATGIAGCLFCNAIGVRNPSSLGSVYYRPTRLPLDLDPNDMNARASNLDARALPLRTTEQYLAAAASVDAASDPAFASTFHGVNSTPLLSTMPGWDALRSCPAEPLHLILLNVGKTLLRLLLGTFGPLQDMDDSSYAATPAAAREIAMLIIESKLTVPSVFGRPPVHLVNDFGLMTAEDISNLYLFYLPYILPGRAPLCMQQLVAQLTSIWKRLTAYQLRREDLGKLKEDIATFVLAWEDTFYKREKDRLAACPSTLHALLHVADSIENSCPTRVNATWQLERFCETVVKMLTSRRHPNANITTHILHLEQLKIVMHKYSLDSLLDRAPATGPSVPLHEYGLQSTLQGKATIMERSNHGPLFRRIEDHLTLSRFHIRQKLRQQVLSYPRLTLDNGTTIRAADFGVKRTVDIRDASWIAFTRLEDKYYEQSHKEPEYHSKLCFGQVSLFIRTESAEEHVWLAAVRECRHQNTDEGILLDDRDHLGALEIIELASIGGLIGRVKRGQHRGSGVLLPKDGVARPTFDAGDLLVVQ